MRTDQSTFGRLSKKIWSPQSLALKLSTEIEETTSRDWKESLKHWRKGKEMKNCGVEEKRNIKATVATTTEFDFFAVLHTHGPEIGDYAGHACGQVRTAISVRGRGGSTTKC